MKVLVTGGAGYLGSVLVRRLLEAGHYVRVLDNLLFGDESIRDLKSNSRFQLVEGDISNLQDVTVAMNDVDGVIALAAIVGDPACKINGDLSVRTNYWATKLLIEVAESQGAKKFLFASTCSVYGASQESLSSEDGWTNPLSLYAETKLDSEKALMKLNGNLEPSVLRLSTLCGPSYRMRFDLVLNIMTATAYTDNQVRVFGGSQYRPLLDVSDAARSFQLILELPKEETSHRIYNIGSSSNNVTISELGKTVSDTMGGVPIVRDPDVRDERSYRVDFTRIRDLGFKDVMPLEDSVRGVARLFEEKRVVNYRESRYYNSKYDYVSSTNGE